MQLQFYDRLTIDRSHRTKDGYLRVTAKGARSGVQKYLGCEVDPEGKSFAADQDVNVYRPAEEVFKRDTLASFVGRPITDDHPAKPVTAKNWRDLSRGVVGGAVKDGEWIGFDLALMDAGLIEKVDGGKRELSCGYECEVSIEDGTTPDGEAYQAVQRHIFGNHLAVVDCARAGPEARIRDGGNASFATCDSVPFNIPTLEDQEPPMKIKIGDAEVDATNGEAVRIAVDALNTKLVTLATDKATAETQVATLTTDKAALEAKVTTLDTQLADAKLTPAQLRDAGKAYQATADKAKALGVTITDEMDEPAIRKAVVTAKVGDAAKDWTEAQIAASFDTLTADAKGGNVVNLNPAINVGDAETSFADTQRKLSDQRRNAWKNPASAAAQ